MNEVLAKIIARKNQHTKKVEAGVESSAIESPAVVDQSPAVVAFLSPCPACGSAIRWLNAAAVPRCIGCQPPKFAALVRSREVLVMSVGLGRKSDGEAFPVDVRRWEKLIEIREGKHRGRLLSETGIRELISRGELDPLTAAHLTAASVGVDSNGEGVAGAVGGMIGDEIQLARAAAQFDRWRELSEEETENFFESQKQQRNQKQGSAK